jgi:methylthioribose-1-phosphate isomerase
VTIQDTSGEAALPKSVRWSNDELFVLDQRLLPHTETEIHCRAIEQVHDAIVTLAVRGAPAIGIAAAYGMLLGLELFRPGQEFITEVKRRAEYLSDARPTAVNLSWAVNRIVDAARQASTGGNVLDILRQEALNIHEEDRVACRRIGEHGAPLISDGATVLTHCNAGALAVSEFGTALAPIYTAWQQGNRLHVYVDETRPLLQGARLTAYELMRSGVPCTLVTDNMAAHLMSEGKVDLVMVGADRVAANGDVANKIGTLNLAILCDYFDIPFYIACPSSTLDAATSTGDDIRIEQRDAREVTHLGDVMHAPWDVQVENPAFDVTPAALVSAIITENGVFAPHALDVQRPV